MNPFSLYLHIPFCRHRCAYCDFNAYSGLDDLIPDYVGALIREIELVAEAIDELLAVHTLYFGGGTPSLLPLRAWDAVIQSLNRNFNLLPNPEVTLEANPSDVSYMYLDGLRSLGFNRLSLGMQSANPEELRLMERDHDYHDVNQAVTWARKAGFENISLDLIFGLPYQELETWQHSLDLALGLDPGHFSLYALTLEHGTPMQSWVSRGLLLEPDADRVAEMYEWAADRLAKAGYVQYEISNWARSRVGESKLFCRHNLQYWRNLPYLGFGAGAHGFAEGHRTANVRSPHSYIYRCLNGSKRDFPCSPATVNLSSVDKHTEMQETMMMSLRLTQEGISDGAFRDRFGATIRDVFEDEVDPLVEMGLLEWSGSEKRRLRLTERGRLLGNQVFMQFV